MSDMLCDSGMIINTCNQFLNTFKHILYRVLHQTHYMCIATNAATNELRVKASMLVI